ncbi:MAG TPA: glycosyltransferase family 4 protein [Bdellovibrionales bacterium]|nr:glycosyltransferase family 4 protein [Bdellovibrionales bacterium]
MRIAQVAPLYESVPPTGYGGTERVVHTLTEELVRQGHDVTLFASGDSLTSARLLSVCGRALRTDPDSKFPLLPHLELLDEVITRRQEFDVIHFHIDPYHFPYLHQFKDTATLTTLHGRLDFKEYRTLFHRFSRAPLVSISDSQRRPVPWANWAATVYHGLAPGLLAFEPKPGGYLAFLGRLSPEKRVDRAIEIARLTGMKLKIAAKKDPAESHYFENVLAPLMKLPFVEYVGEIGEREKQEFLGQATALLFPIDWPEPFGIAMIEALACGTPIIAWRNGSVPEIVKDGVNGFIVESLEEAARAVEKIETISREACRRSFESNYTSEIMASNYVQIYENLADNATRRLRETVIDFENDYASRPGWMAKEYVREITFQEL